MILRLSQNKKLFITKQTHTDFEKSKNEHFNLYNHLRNEFKGKNEYGSSLNYLNNINKKIENLSNYLELNVFQNMELIDNVSEEFKRTHF
ncbi:MAG: hypothetical protein HRU03_08555 [Nanoarchaeales archaeon]|nr:hypothetical protein [Nanoarchaeales archaeon]